MVLYGPDTMLFPVFPACRVEIPWVPTTPGPPRFQATKTSVVWVRHFKLVAGAFSVPQWCLDASETEPHSPGKGAAVREPSGLETKGVPLPQSPAAQQARPPANSAAITAVSVDSMHNFELLVGEGHQPLLRLSKWFFLAQKQSCQEVLNWAGTPNSLQSCQKLAVSVDLLLGRGISERKGSRPPSAYR